MARNPDEAPLNSASATSVRKRKQSEKLRLQLRLDRLRRLLELDDYRIEGWDFLAWCGVFHHTDVDDPQRLALAEGRRRAGLRFLAEHEAARPGALELMRVAHTTRPDSP